MDLNGNVTLLVNTATGLSAATYDYGPLGQPLRQSGGYAASEEKQARHRYTRATCSQSELITERGCGNVSRSGSIGSTLERGGGEDDFCLHRLESAAGGDGEGSGGLSLKEIRRGDWWPGEGEWEEGPRRIGAGTAGAFWSGRGRRILGKGFLKKYHRLLLMSGAEGAGTQRG